MANRPVAFTRSAFNEKTQTEIAKIYSQNLTPEKAGEKLATALDAELSAFGAKAHAAFSRELNILLTQLSADATIFKTVSNNQKLEFTDPPFTPSLPSVETATPTESITPTRKS